MLCEPVTYDADVLNDVADAFLPLRAGGVPGRAARRSRRTGPGSCVFNALSLGLRRCDPRGREDRVFGELRR